MKRRCEGIVRLPEPVTDVTRLGAFISPATCTRPFPRHGSPNCSLSKTDAIWRFPPTHGLPGWRELDAAAARGAEVRTEKRPHDPGRRRIYRPGGAVGRSPRLAPDVDGTAVHYNGSPNRYGIPAFYELHVWAARHNPNGVFADLNPRVSCEDAPSSISTRAEQRGSKAARCPASVTGRVMLAVLPFETLGEAADDYLGDGLTEEMGTQLGLLVPDRLAVIARTSAMHARRPWYERLRTEARFRDVLARLALPLRPSSAITRPAQPRAIPPLDSRWAASR